MMRIDYVRMETVQRWPRNPKEHAEGELDESIERFGYVAPMTMDEGTGRLVAGHGRLEALQRRKERGEPPPDRVRVDEDGEWLVPVLRGIEFKDEREAEAYLLADNRLVETGGWDQAMLGEMLSDIVADPEDLDGLGWTDEEVGQIVNLDALGQSETGEKIKRKKNQQENWDTFINDDTVPKQIAFYFTGDEYDSVAQRIEQVLDDAGAKGEDRNTTTAFLYLMRVYEERT